MTQIIINRAAVEDVETIQAIRRQTFSETFAKSNTEEDMQKYLDENFSTGKIDAELNNPDSLFLLPGKRTLL